MTWKDITHLLVSAVNIVRDPWTREFLVAKNVSCFESNEVLQAASVSEFWAVMKQRFVETSVRQLLNEKYSLTDPIKRGTGYTRVTIGDGSWSDVWMFAYVVCSTRTSSFANLSYRQSSFHFSCLRGYWPPSPGFTYSFAGVVWIMAQKVSWNARALVAGCELLLDMVSLRPSLIRNCHTEHWFASPRKIEEVEAKPSGTCWGRSSKRP